MDLKSFIIGALGIAIGVASFIWRTRTADEVGDHLGLTSETHVLVYKIVAVCFVIFGVVIVGMSVIG